MTKARDLGDNAQNTKPKVVDAKGDLIVGTGADAADRLAAPSESGSTLVADSAASTGLRWQGNYAAGKNKIINGDFSIWQRGTSFSNPSNGDFAADRWRATFNGTSVTRTISRQAFTAGAAPVAGYESQYFYRFDISAAGTSNTFNRVSQRIEDARTFAGQTVTVSFWAKADAARNVTPNFFQNFGSGGSPSGEVTISGSAIALTTSWARYSQTFSITSVSGKTFGTANDSFLQFSLDLPSNTTMTIDIWGVQVEAGNVATAFQTATGTLQGETAAAMRYFYRISSQSTGHRIGNGFNSSTTRSIVPLYFPVAFRGSPSVTASNVTDFTLQHGGTPTNTTASAIGFGNVTGSMLDITVDVASGLTIGALSQLRAANGTGFIDFSAEL